ncbi:hypothetical protein [Corynebacterium aquilae]|uniref:DUF4439 domain-containing protein n=1 Tax=Corynebacterium aquilae DSM 44791 TaxID=1431546 RepID=A0A1L7CEW3_9CORY|nr:hypothetical protein [Corynebacterium aquilae]APT84376.1 hypothetical protein CAQU_04035 [Corynebacterium aquilae DSM 44791]
MRTTKLLATTMAAALCLAATAPAHAATPRVENFTHVDGTSALGCVIDFNPSPADVQAGQTGVLGDYAKQLGSLENDVRLALLARIDNQRLSDAVVAVEAGKLSPEKFEAIAREAVAADKELDDSALVWLTPGKATTAMTQAMNQNYEDFVTKLDALDRPLSYGEARDAASQGFVIPGSRIATKDSFGTEWANPQAMGKATPTTAALATVVKEHAATDSKLNELAAQIRTATITETLNACMSELDKRGVSHDDSHHGSSTGSAEEKLSNPLMIIFGAIADFFGFLRSLFAGSS